jgi:hypothetical protein
MANLAAEAANIDSMLSYIGFNAQAERTAIAQDGFESFDDLLQLKDKDIDTMSKGFADRTAAGGRITFGLKKTRLLKATLNWAQDFRRISRPVSMVGITNAAEFRVAIQEAQERSDIRRDTEDESELSKTADPGKLKKAGSWIAWSRGLRNYLSTMQGRDGVPLSYIIRENELPDYSLESVAGFDFQSLSVDAAPLTGLNYTTDAKKVHQIIHGLVQGEIAETWIKPTERRQNGRVAFLALQSHYGGEGNKSVRIKEAEGLRKNLMYKSERTMSFELFLTKMQTMFIGFLDSQEVIEPPQQIRLLFDKVQCPGLETVKNSLQVAHDLDNAAPPNVTYDFIANSLSAEAQKSADFVPNRQASGVGSHTGGPAPASGVRDEAGVIFTGYYPNFNKLSKGDKDTIQEERKRLGIQKHNGGKKPGGKPRNSSSIKSNKKKLKTLKREIAAMKVTHKELKDKKGEDSDDDEPQDDAGNQFGGRKAKKSKKSG